MKPIFPLILILSSGLLAQSKTTKGLIQIEKNERPAGAIQLVGDKGHSMIPEGKGPSKWTFNDGVLTASPVWDSVITKDTYQDFRMHVEFNVNDVPDAKDAEKNGNSGVYIQQRYEIQILNSHGISAEDYKASYAGSLYRMKKPDKLVSKKAGEWQTYDIAFRAARFKDGKKTENARITVYHNGELIHDDFSIPNKTGAGKKEGPEPGPIKLQGHHNPVKFRNVWIQKLDLSSKPKAEEKKPKKKGYTYAVPFEDIPPAPPLNPADALKSFKIHEEFEIELAASDPQVQSPLAIQFDGNGRMWVVEMRSYMLDENATGEADPIGRISILTDTNQDGTFDKYQVFMDGLNQPRSIAFYKNGILYGGHEKLSFVENINDKPGKITVIDENYAGNGNVEHRSNGLLRGLDNWIYNVKSDARYREVDGKWVKEKTTFRGQWGISQNNYGRLFYNQNWFGMKADNLLPNTLRRNSNYPKGFGDMATLSYRDKVFPGRITPGVNRGGEGAIDENGYLTAVTAACGPVVYRGDQFPEKFRNTAFFCEPSAHFVRILEVSENDGILSGNHPLKESEFLTSTDERFRPVNLFNGPDGTLYLVDLYHGIVQHKAYLTRYLREHIAHRELQTKPRLGRVYRIKHKSSSSNKTPSMLDEKTADLVPHLAHPNGWWRDTAQRLLIDRDDPKVVPLLNDLVSDHSKPLGQIHALWTLEGLGALNPTIIKTALQSQDPHVLEMAIRLGERLDHDGRMLVLMDLVRLSHHKSVVVQRQLASSLGRYPGQLALEALAPLLHKNIDQPYFREAAVHGLHGREQEFLDLVGDTLKDCKLRAYLEECLRPKTNASAFKLPRDKKHLEVFKKGEKIYLTHCTACHGIDGNGLPQLGPPLVKSEWVTGSQERLSAILLQGLMGPITVAGKKYTPPAAMPGLKHSPEVTDAQLAEVATFIRYAWNNGKGAVKPETLSKVRDTLKDRETVFSPEELQKAFP